MSLEIIPKYIMDLLRNGINKTNIMKLKWKLLNKNLSNEKNLKIYLTTVVIYGRLMRSIWNGI